MGILFSVPAWPGSLIPIDSQRSQLSLNGPWSVTIGQTTEQLTVPVNIPFTFAPSVWTRVFTLNLPSAPAVAFLKFGGIVNTATVRLNGVSVGELTAFTETTLDVVGSLNINGQNTLELTIDDRLNADTVPGGPVATYLPTAGFLANTFPVAWANRPGIVRSVSLVYSPQAVIAQVLTDQNFNADLSALDLQIRVRTTGPLAPGTYVFAAVALNGTILGSCPAPVATGGEFQCSIHLDTPRLWTTTLPVLHDLSIALVSSTGLADAGRDRIGFRKFEVRGSRFYLNNKPIFLRGITRHDVYDTRGFVADDQTIQEDLFRIQNLGVNYIRCIHYPPDEAFVRFADQFGMLVSEEIPAWANFRSSNVLSVATGMIRAVQLRDYNRASVVIYYVGSLNDDPATTYLVSMLQTAHQNSGGRLISYIYDDSAHTSEVVANHARDVKLNGADFYAQNSYWHSSTYADASAGFPVNGAMMATEWSGAEGSDRDAIGGPNTVAFPDTSTADGFYSEAAMSFQIRDSVAAFYPYLCSDYIPTKCLAGVVYYNWQDLDWPSMSFFFPNHYPVIRDGLVYEDRTGKLQPLTVFNILMALLPR